MTSLSRALVRWDHWFYRLRIEPEQGEIVRRDAPAWLIKRLTVRGRLLLTDSALYYKSSSAILLQTPQTQIRLPFAEILNASVRHRVEWRAALPGLSSFEVRTANALYVFQTAESDAWVAAIVSADPV